MFSNEVERGKKLLLLELLLLLSSTTKFEKANATLFLTEIKACICFNI